MDGGGVIKLPFSFANCKQIAHLALATQTKNRFLCEFQISMVYLLLLWNLWYLSYWNNEVSPLNSTEHHWGTFQLYLNDLSRSCLFKTMQFHQKYHGEVSPKWVSAAGCNVRGSPELFILRGTCTFTKSHDNPWNCWDISIKTTNVNLLVAREED